jgi:hypothetical protein
MPAIVSRASPSRRGSASSNRFTAQRSRFARNSTRARALDREQLAEEVARGVAVIRAEPLDLLAEQHAVVRLVGVDATQCRPSLAAGRVLLEDGEQRVRARALSLEHAVEEGDLLLVRKRGFRHGVSRAL